jgi:hypothetical protein
MIINFVALDESDYLYNYKNIKCFPLDKLANQKYIFPIPIHNTGTDSGYFVTHEQTGFGALGDTIAKDVKNNRAKIVLIFPLEGFVGSGPGREKDFEILDKWCKNAGFTKDQVYFIHGNFAHREPTEYNFTYVPVHAFHCWLRTPIKSIIEYQPVDDKNLFLSYNRRCDWHRLLLLCQLIDSNLLDRGLVSYFGKAIFNNNASSVELISPHRLDLIDAAAKLDTLIPMQLDIDLESNNPVHEIVAQHHEQTFLNVVTETLFRPGAIFYSEKTWKPILAGQPFMYIATAGALAELRRQGYQTFGSWWDESYDNEPDLDKRITMVITELDKLSKLPMQELVNIRKEMRTVLEHNQNLFNYYRNDVYRNHPDEFLYQEIKKIWNSF